MRTIKDLQTFYESDLSADLVTLEGQRKGVLKKVIIAAVIVLGLAAAGAGVGLSQTGSPAFVVFPLIFGAVIVGGIAHYCSRGYTSCFKDLIIDRLVKFIEPGLDYQKSSYISESVFRRSELFQHRIDRYKGDDMVRGRIGVTDIEFSEIHAEYKTTTTDSKGRRQTHWHTIFKGLFFIGDFNKHFQGSTYVLPDTAERLLGRFGQKLQSMSRSHGELIKLEDIEFEKEFVVYGTDQIEARYILSPALMKRITEFKQKSRRTIHLGFIYSNVYVAISYSKDLFEPRLFRTLLDFRPIQEYFEDLQLAISIVEELNLNTRLWTKR